MRVEAAIDSAKGSWYETDASVARMLCTASASAPKRLNTNVRISKARYSASIMTIPGDREEDYDTCNTNVSTTLARTGTGRRTTLLVETWNGKPMA